MSCAAPRHIVQVYRDERYLSGSLAEWARIGLARGEGLLLLTTDEQWRAVAADLTASGLEVDALQRDERLVRLDAAAALALVCPGGRPDRDAFAATLGGRVAGMLRRTPRLRCFGELVNLLTERGQLDDALVLERYWNELLRATPGVTLLCGYAARSLHACGASDDAARAAYDALVETHARTVPRETLESWADDALYRRVAALELRSVVLEEDSDERRDLEEQLAAAKVRLAETGKLRLLSELCAGIAHELNNPLSVIKGTARLARMASAKAEPSEDGALLDRRLGRIERSASRMERVVQDILSFSTRDVRLGGAPVDVHALVRGAVDVERDSCADEDVALRVDAADEPLLTKGEMKLLTQVLTSLIANARDAIQAARAASGASRGVITVSAAKTPEQRIRVAVEDDGEGMDEEVQRRMFVPFFTRREPGRGMGLGLSLAHGIVTAHGGTITCASAPGRGTTFTVLLPAT